MHHPFRLILPLGISALLLGGCAGLSHKPAAPAVPPLSPALAATTAPAAGSASTLAPAATTTGQLASLDSATPIPDLNDTSPEIQWEDLSITPAEAKNDNLWDYLAKNFSLSSDGGDGRIQEKLDWYTQHAAYLQRMANRAKPYLYYIVQQVKARDMPLDIALLPVVESAFDPYAHSYGNASGLWQFIPGTARNWDLKQDWWYDGRRDVVASTRAALDYLQYLHNQFDGNWLLALAAYNSGGGTVSRAIERNQRRGLPTDFWNLDLPAETRAYVPWLLAICKLVATPGHDGVDLPPIPDKPYFAEVDTGGQIDLDAAAKLAGITSEQMYLLNPGFNRWATDPSGPDELLVPLDKQAQFTAGLAAMPASERVQWATHRVESGDTLGAIAHDNHTTVAILQRVNSIRSNLIHPGQILLIPKANNGLAQATLVAEARVAERRRYGVARSAFAGATVHQVRNGESLWTIAQHYHVSVAQLARWNGISPHGLLHVGQKLAIRPRRSIAQVTANNTESPATTDNGHKMLYTVHSGDSLYSISSRFDVSVSSIANWNKLDPGDYLHPGQRLELYVSADTASAGS